MTVHLDEGDLRHELAALAAHPRLRKVAVVLPLAPGMAELAEAYLAEGPPFDLEAAGLRTHEVLLTDKEAIFVFGLANGPETLERILADDDFWTVARPWEHIASGRPYLARVLFNWASVD